MQTLPRPSDAFQPPVSGRQACRGPRFLPCALAAACLGAAPAWSWTSAASPLSDAIHQTAIDKVLAAPRLTDDQRQTLKDEQSVIDRDQQASQSEEHAMTGIENASETEDEQRPRYIAKTEAYLRANLQEAIRHKQAGEADPAMKALARVIHALEDATSPAHAPFQPWHYNETFWAKVQHVARERTYPDAGTARAQLEGVVLWAYDLYVGKAAPPAHFFDTAGVLELPRAYDGK